MNCLPFSCIGERRGRGESPLTWLQRTVAAGPISSDNWQKRPWYGRCGNNQSTTFQRVHVQKQQGWADQGLPNLAGIAPLTTYMVPRPTLCKHQEIVCWAPSSKLVITEMPSASRGLCDAYSATASRVTHRAGGTEDGMTRFSETSTVSTEMRTRCHMPALLRSLHTH